MVFAFVLITYRSDVIITVNKHTSSTFIDVIEYT